ncbi:MAG: arginine--tRNA ligase [Nitrosomonas sp.]|nr:MAG: arginine--tRNA ligase [Nitrosomonas sp.]
MKSLISQLFDKFQQAVSSAYPELLLDMGNLPIEITQSTNEKFGHYQCNTAMKLAKPIGLAPRKVAEHIISHVDLTDRRGHPMIAHLDIAGPGFINIMIEADYLARSLNNVLGNERLGVEKPTDPKKIIVEFSSPNTAKELHVGHLRSTIIGDCLARLFEFLGHDVLRLNHVGDWGTAFGMLIAYMKEQAPNVLKGEEHTDLTHLVGWYKASKMLFDTDEEFKRRSRLEVVKLQGGDTDSLYAWQIICNISREAYQEIYDLLDVKLLERGESFYNPMLAEVVADLESKGLVTISDGAKCIFLEGFQNREGQELPLMIQKSDGGYNYDTTDMAAIRHRCEVEEADRIICVTDAGQATHFAMIFKAAEKAGYINSAKNQVDHVTFGLVLGPDGKKFRTRSGETERLIDLLTNAVEKADEILKERSSDIDSEERLALAKALGIGAVKYADLSTHRQGDYTFSYDRMLRFDGNTAAFVMYAYVRIASIKRKVGVDICSLFGKEKITLQHPSEISLALHLIQFHETLDLVAKDLLPNRLTDYIFNLAEKFNAFFRDCRVEGSTEQNSRLLLCELVAQTLQLGLHILGIPTVERM